MNLPLTKENLFSVKNATVAFFKFDLNGIETLYFDSSASTPPHPMVNAMAGLKTLEANQQLIMINHHSPDGLFPKIESDFNYEVEELDNGTVKVVFSRKTDATYQTDFNDNQCGGGCEH